METYDTLDDRGSTRGSRQKTAGVVIVFCVSSPCYQWVPLIDGKLRIGRKAELGLVLDARLSREHAEIAFDGERWSVTDLGSRNGTFVDGRATQHASFAVMPRIIRMGHTIVLPLGDGWPAVIARPMREESIVAGPLLRSSLGDVEKAATAGHNVLITGESGTGKELAAKTFHARGPHRSGPLVAVNCATIPHGVAERLLFGAKRGAYSGSAADTEGYVQSAHGGVLFLDELGELDLEVQAKLLRVVETKEVLPLGATSPKRVDVRFCFATHRDLREGVAAGRFRADLYYRVSQPEVILPPLRDRLEEIPWHIVDEAERVTSSIVVSAEFVEQCMLRAWPGNIRELRGEVRRAAHALQGTASTTLRPEQLMARAGLAIERRPSEPPRSMTPMPSSPRTTPDGLPPDAPSEAPADRAMGMPEDRPSGSGDADGDDVPDETVTPADGVAFADTGSGVRRGITRERIEEAFRQRGNATAVARELGVHRSHLYRLMKQHGVVRPRES